MKTGSEAKAYAWMDNDKARADTDDFLREVFRDTDKERKLARDADGNIIKGQDPLIDEAINAGRRDLLPPADADNDSTT